MRDSAARPGEGVHSNRVITISHRINIPVEGAQIFPVEMHCGEELLTTVSPSGTVAVYVTDSDGYRDWLKEMADGDYFEDGMLPHPNHYVGNGGFREERTVEFWATHKERFFVFVFNMADKRVRIQLDLALWGRDQTPLPEFDDCDED